MSHHSNCPEGCPCEFTCRACDGNGWWMAPVYHNERVKETCSHCNGAGVRRPSPKPPAPQPSNVIRVDFRRARR